MSEEGVLGAINIAIQPPKPKTFSRLVIGPLDGNSHVILRTEEESELEGRMNAGLSRISIRYELSRVVRSFTPNMRNEKDGTS